MFYIDNETTKDLEIFSFEKKKASLIECFKKTNFLGGYDKIQEIFSSPTNDLQELTDRQEIIRFFTKFHLSFESSREDLDYIEYYLISTIEPLRTSNKVSFLLEAIAYRLLVKRVYDYNVISLAKVVRFLHDVRKILEELSVIQVPSALRSHMEKAATILEKRLLKRLASQKVRKRLFFVKLFAYDSDLRLKYHQDIKMLLQIMYMLDAFSTIARVAEERGMSLPLFKETDTPALEMEGVVHPFLTDPVSNDLRLGDGRNMIFLTGPNMAGKTTLLKSIGISVFMAHLGLPVPCRNMRLSIFNGLITNINTADNLKIGYSYYYSEVKRVKSVAEKFRDNRKMVWIGDELFRGTNIKDAYDASKLIVTSFARVKDSIMIISSHLVELAKEIDAIPTITFQQMKTLVKDGEPQFTYTMSEGVSDIRLGLYILKKEGIEEIITECLRD